MGVLLVEQNALQSLKIAEKRFSSKSVASLRQRRPPHLRNDPSVIESYLGGAGSAKAA